MLHRVFILSTVALIASAVLLFGNGQEKIVFAVEVNDDLSEIYTINPDGSGVEFFFSFASELADSTGWIEDLRISPSGAYIAFTSNHDHLFSPFKENVFHISSDGSWWDMDTPDAAAGWYNPPGGRGTVYGDVENFGSPNAWVSIEGYPEIITTDATGYYNVSNVPEGSRFITAWSFNMGWYDYVPVNVVAGRSVEAPTLYTTQDDWNRSCASNQTWSPDASYIYWKALDTSVLKTPRGGNGWTEIFPSEPAFVDRSTIDISPVNGKIVYTWSVWDPSSGGVYTANLDGSDTTKIFDDQYAYASSSQYPRWSPDGERIAYVSYQDGENSAVVINKNGDYQTHFYFSGHYLSVGGWSPNSKWLVVSVWTNPDSVYIYAVQPDFLQDSCVGIVGPANIELGVDWGILNPQEGIEEKTDKSECRITNVELTVYPNPFIKETAIRYTIPVENKKSVIKIFDMSGRIVKTFTNLAKSQMLQWNNKVPAGIYFIHLSVDNNPCKTLKITKLR